MSEPQPPRKPHLARRVTGVVGGLVGTVGGVVGHAVDLLSGAIDILVIEHPDGTYKSTPFHVRFGRLKLLRTREKVVQIIINGEIVPCVMKLGEAGEAYFVEEAQEPIPRELVTSPIASPIGSMVEESEFLKQFENGQLESPTIIIQEDSGLGGDAPQLMATTSSVEDLSDVQFQFDEGEFTPIVHTQPQPATPTPSESFAIEQESPTIMVQGANDIEMGVSPTASQTTGGENESGNEKESLSQSIAARAVSEGEVEEIMEKEGKWSWGWGALPQRRAMSPPPLPPPLSSSSSSPIPQTNPSSPPPPTIPQSGKEKASFLSAIWSALYRPRTAIAGGANIPNDADFLLSDEDIRRITEMDLQLREILPERPTATGGVIPTISAPSASENGNNFEIIAPPPPPESAALAFLAQNPPDLSSLMISTPDREIRKIKNENGIKINTGSDTLNVEVFEKQPKEREIDIRVKLDVRKSRKTTTMSQEGENEEDSDSMVVHLETSTNLFEQENSQPQPEFQPEQEISTQLEKLNISSTSTSTPGKAAESFLPISESVNQNQNQISALRRVQYSPSDAESESEGIPSPATGKVKHLKKHLTEQPSSSSSAVSYLSDGDASESELEGAYPMTHASSLSSSSQPTLQPTRSWRWSWFSKKSASGAANMNGPSAPTTSDQPRTSLDNNTSGRDTPINSISTSTQQTAGGVEILKSTSSQPSSGASSPQQALSPSPTNGASPPTDSEPQQQQAAIGTITTTTTTDVTASVEISVHSRGEKLLKKSLKPSSEQLSRMKLKEGCNSVKFVVQSRITGRQEVTARIFLWKSDSKVVISDIDGTVTKSDALGHILPMFGKDWSHAGIARLYSDIQANGFKILYLTTRPIGQAGYTRDYIVGLKQQGGDTMPEGPVVTSPDRLFYAFAREVLLKKPEEFKIAALRDIRALFSESYNPFYAGFGNRVTDVISYRTVGVPPSKIFTVNYKSEIQICYKSYKSYSDLNQLVHEIFPPLKKNADPETDVSYNAFSFWRLPLPDV